MNDRLIRCPICGGQPCAAEGKPYCWRHWAEMKGRLR